MMNDETLYDLWLWYMDEAKVYKIHDISFDRGAELGPEWIKKTTEAGERADYMLVMSTSDPWYKSIDTIDIDETFITDFKPRSERR